MASDDSAGRRRAALIGAVASGRWWTLLAHDTLITLAAGESALVGGIKLREGNTSSKYWQPSDHPTTHTEGKGQAGFD
jgi:hypothetical protein